MAQHASRQSFDSVSANEAHAAVELPAGWHHLVDQLAREAPT
jgi:hypothetical protein